MALQPNPYRTAPSRSFWSRSVAGDWQPADLVAGEGPLIRKGDTVASAGSCFAANIVPYLQRAGFNYLRTEARNPAFAHVEPERLGYDNFSAAYGNIYTARQLLQLIQRCLGTFRPAEDRWQLSETIVDPFRPGLRYPAASHREFDLLTAQHLRRTLGALCGARVFIFTLGLTETWVSRIDGAVFPACPGTVAGSFDPERHEFKNFAVGEVVADLDQFFLLLRELNPELRMILTVSPVPLVATATGQHVLTASTYSKSVLRVAASEISARHADVIYFPAYEIVTGPQAPKHFFDFNRRNVTTEAIDAVMEAFLARCEIDGAAAIAAGDAVPEASSAFSAALAEAECEEVMADRG